MRRIAQCVYCTKNFCGKREGWEVVNQILENNSYSSNNSNSSSSSSSRLRSALPTLQKGIIARILQKLQILCSNFIFNIILLLLLF